MKYVVARMLHLVKYYVHLMDRFDLIFQRVWSMSEKNVEEVEGVLPGIFYFAQQDSAWYSNSAGNKHNHYEMP